jgi:hypothetical protein
MISDPTLSERRKADRAAMAVRLTDAITEAGGTVQPDPQWNRAVIHALMLLITAPGGAFVHVEFNGKSIQPNTYVVTWNILSDAKHRHVRFAEIGDVNPFHRAKATRVAYGFEQLCDLLVADVRRFVDGSGYEQPNPTPTPSRNSR